MRISQITLLALAGSLTACMGVGGGMKANRSLESVRQPVVEISNYSLDVEAYGGDLQPSERQRLADWLEAMNASYGDRIAIDTRTGPVDRAAREAVSAAASRHGLLLADHAPMTAGQPAPGMIRIVMSRSMAHVPGCPNWSQQSTTNIDSRTSPNYGCATNGNVAAMVADPIDLVRGKSAGVSDPVTASQAIQKYRRNAPGATGGSSSGGESSGGQSSGGGN